MMALLISFLLAYVKCNEQHKDEFVRDKSRSRMLRVRLLKLDGMYPQEIKLPVKMDGKIK